MKDLDFYTIPNDYVVFLQNAEKQKRCFSRVPNLKYSEKRKPKFLCGIVLNINDTNYFVPVSSYKIKKPDNFLICDKNNKPTSSLRFNYMFPVPLEIIKQRSIDDEKDLSYKALLSQELTYCIDNQDDIRKLAYRTYKRVLLGKNKGLVHNSCDFLLLEEKCQEYIQAHILSEQVTVPNKNSTAHTKFSAPFSRNMIKDNAKKISEKSAASQSPQHKKKEQDL